MKEFNWAVCFICSMVCATGATFSGIGALMFFAAPGPVFVILLVLSLGLYAAAFAGLHTMERI
jgi:hypothetical protein